MFFSQLSSGAMSLIEAIARVLSRFMLLQNNTAHLKPPETRLIKLYSQNILPHGRREAEDGCSPCKTAQRRTNGTVCA